MCRTTMVATEADTNIIQNKCLCNGAYRTPIRRNIAEILLPILRDRIAYERGY